MLKKLVLLGAGGHASACCDVIFNGQEFSVDGFILESGYDKSVERDYPVLGVDSDIPKFVVSDRFFLVAVGQIVTAQPRKSLFKNLIEHNANLPVVIAARAYVSPTANLGLGSIVMNFAHVGPKASVGVNAIINTGAKLEHGVTVGDHCHISTGAILNGDVSVGCDSFIGSGAVVHHGVSIGSRVIINAGALVDRDVSDGFVFK